MGRSVHRFVAITGTEIDRKMRLQIDSGSRSKWMAHLLF